MIPELKNIVVSYCNNLDDILIFQGYHQHRNKDLIRLPKSYQLPTIEQCAKNGHLLSGCYLRAMGQDYTLVMDSASAHGSLEIVQFFHAIGQDCTTLATDYASQNGHLEVVKYLYSIGKKITINAKDLASRRGHLEVVEFLDSIAENCENESTQHCIIN